MSATGLGILLSILIGIAVLVEIIEPVSLLTLLIPTIIGASIDALIFFVALLLAFTE